MEHEVSSTSDNVVPIGSHILPIASNAWSIVNDARSTRKRGGPNVEGTFSIICNVFSLECYGLSIISSVCLTADRNFCWTGHVSSALQGSQGWEHPASDLASMYHLVWALPPSGVHCQTPQIVCACIVLGLSENRGLGLERVTRSSPGSIDATSMHGLVTLGDTGSTPD